MAVTLSHYRFGIDELAESTHGWHAAEDTNPSAGTIALDTTFLLRFTLQCDGTAQSNVDSEFQYRVNSGTWTNINTTSTVVRAVAATALTNGGNCTKRLSGTGTFETTGAGQTEDGISGGTANDIVANGNSETECGLTLRSVDIAGGDVIEFRLTRDGGTLLDTYSVVPTLTIPDEDMDGVSAGTSTSTGVLKGLGTLAASSTGAATAAGVLAGKGALAGTAAGTSTATGVLEEAGGSEDMIGASAGTSTAAGVLTGRGVLVAVSAGTATGTAVLRALGVLAAASAGVAGAVGVLRGRGTLAGTAAGAGAATGVLGEAGSNDMVGASAGVATVLGVLKGRGALIGASAGVGAGTAVLRALGALAAAAAGTSGAVGVLSGASSSNMIGASAGSATAVGLLRAFGRLAGTAAGTSTAALASGAASVLSVDNIPTSTIVQSLGGWRTVSSHHHGGIT